MRKKISKGFGIILLVTIFSIVLHANLPQDSTSNSVPFDSLLIKAIGFPAVASLYFFILFLQLYLAFRYVFEKTQASVKNSAFRIAIAFTIIPLIAMPEITPGAQWTLKVTFNQVLIGIFDGIPVLLLVFLMYKFCIDEKRRSDTYKQIVLQGKSKVLLISSVASVFIIERVICYKTGITLSAIDDYPIPCLVWTIVFGITVGIACTILYPVYHAIGRSTRQSAALMFLTMGLYWIWFNNFIAMLSKNMIIQMTTRSAIDVAVVIGCISLLKGKIKYEEV